MPRPRRKHAKRWACGKAQPEGATPELLAKRAAAAGEANAKRQEAGSVLGIWSLKGLITNDERDQGYELARLQQAVKSAIQAPREAIAMLGESNVLTLPEDPERYARLMKAYRRRIAMINDCGLAVARAVELALSDDWRASPGLAKIGLYALVLGSKKSLTQDVVANRFGNASGLKL